MCRQTTIESGTCNPSCIIKSPKAGRIATKYSHGIESNHQDRNFQFRKSSPKYARLVRNQVNRQHHVFLHHPFVFRPHQQFIETIKKPFIGIDDLNWITQQIESTLVSEGLIKSQITAKERIVPGTFISEELSVQLRLPLDRELSSEGIFRLATESKESSLAFQSYISDSSRPEAEWLASHLQGFLPLLISHEFGNFILQKLVSKSEGFQRMVENHCWKNFKELATNEFASRVMQLLIERSDVFCNFVLQFFSKQFSMATLHNAACHLLIAGIKAAKSTDACSFVERNLMQKPRLLASKLFQRILIAFAQVGTPDQLERLASQLRMSRELINLLNRKSGACLVLVLLQRVENQTLETLLWFLRADPATLLQTKFCVFVLQKLWQEKSPVASTVAHELSILPSVRIRELRQSESTFRRLVYLLVNCFGDDHKALAAAFLRRPHVRLCEILLKTKQRDYADEAKC